MINFTKAKEIFEEYTSQFDMSQSGIKRKKEHSLRVASISRMIAEKEGLNPDLAELIGLYHDIARFEQLKRFNNFSDRKTGFDHGDEGAKFIEENGWLKDITDNRNYDKIIYESIINHNKRFIKEGLTEEELKYAKLIRDADKIDIYYLSNVDFLEVVGAKDKTEEDIKKEKISYDAFGEIMRCKQLDLALGTNDANVVMTMIGFLFDINYKTSIHYLEKNGYIQNLLSKLRGGVNELQINQIENVVYEYIRINY